MNELTNQRNKIYEEKEEEDGDEDDVDHIEKKVYMTIVCNMQ